MSNEWDDGTEENPVETDGNGMANLRKAHEREKKRNQELQAQLAELQSRERARTLGETLSAAGANSKLAAFYPADREATPEKVTEWLNEYADVFGQTAAPQAPAQPQVSPELRSIYENFQQPGMNTPSMDEVSAIKNYQFNVGNADTGDEIQKFMAFMRNQPGLVQNPMG